MLASWFEWYLQSQTLDDTVVAIDPNVLDFRLTGSKRGPVHLSFDKDEYERLMLMMIVKNDLPFSLVVSESFRAFVYFLRDDAHSINRSTLRRRLDKIYEKEFDRVKKRLDENMGKFSITIDE